MKTKTYEDIIAWKKSYELTLMIYGYTSDFPRCENFGLKCQMRRAAASVISNIAEGFRKHSKKEAIRFYNMAQCSLEELRCQLRLSKDLKYIDNDTYLKIDQRSNECSKVLYGWIITQKKFLN